MWKTVVLALSFAFGVAACGGKNGVNKHDYAGSITLTIANMSPRVIEQVFIHPPGSPRGASWTDAIPPGASVTVKVQSGNFEIVAVSAKRNLDEHTRERPEATSMLELKKDLKLVFHDAGQEPAGANAEGSLGIAFQISEPEQTKPAPDQTPDTPQGSGNEMSQGTPSP